MLAPVPHLGNADIDWDGEGPRYRDRILDYLERRYIPDLRARPGHLRASSRRCDFRDELNAHVGSAFSLEPVLTQSAYSAPTTATTQIPACTSSAPAPIPGAGIPGVVGSAKATAGLMLDERPP